MNLTTIYSIFAFIAMDKNQGFVTVFVFVEHLFCTYLKKCGRKCLIDIFIIKTNDYIFSGSLKNKNSESFGFSLFVFLIKTRGQQVAHPTPKPSLRAVIYHGIRNLLIMKNGNTKTFQAA